MSTTKHSSQVTKALGEGVDDIISKISEVHDFNKRRGSVREKSVSKNINRDEIFPENDKLYLEGKYNTKKSKKMFL